MGAHILVVDDDPDARELLQTALTYCGALVTVAASASEALTALARVLPDAIVCDVAMPEQDGYWFVRSLRGLPADRGGALPVVAITAHGYTHGPDRTLPAGFQAHIRKPVDPWELCRVLVSLVRKT
ncbi:MAG TPA: response regulator [Candidatus Tectomicrobia bacterium]|nr:response regulator [Candidatus Tectomicrobia bacterium]